MTVVDPPEGWRYGFPASLPDNLTLEQLLRAHRYPEELIALALKYTRYWGKDDV